MVSSYLHCDPQMPVFYSNHNPVHLSPTIDTLQHQPGIRLIPPKLGNMSTAKLLELAPFLMLKLNWMMKIQQKDKTLDDLSFLAIFVKIAICPTFSITFILRGGVIKGRSVEKLEGSNARILGKTLCRDMVNGAPQRGMPITWNTYLIAAAAWQEECHDVVAVAAQAHDF
uniref:Uncharacterized protein n=1 Tax=Lactuca sativa TaxID=4236 RepID=A0A9R1WSX2_LACSA|nr:hypothetical protein LSAT_V11C900477750 [Lactuca sativa]